LVENSKTFSRAHIFNRSRQQIRKLATPVYLGFSAVDYIYAPEFFKKWFYLRLFFFAYVFVLFFLVAKLKILRTKIEFCAISIIAMASFLISIMIYDFRGVNSHYTAGLIMATIFGIQLFKLSRLHAFIAQVLSFAPTILVFILTSDKGEFTLVFVQSSFLIGMALITYIYGTSDDEVQKTWSKFKKNTIIEIEQYRRTEVLKNHFPKAIRDSFARNPEDIRKKKLIPDAVIGFADIVASSKISNVIELPKEWELKEEFLECATKRAMESNMVVLSHLGDGFMFLANFTESSSWSYNLVTFYENLILDYQKIWRNLGKGIEGIESGVKFGVSSGPILVGFIGKQQSYYSAVGSDVNLAARLCSQANPNEMVVSSRVWYGIKTILNGWSVDRRIYNTLKGFSYEVPAVHISSRLIGKEVRLCEVCGLTIALVKTDEGFIDFRCASGHSTSVSPIPVLEMRKLNK
jgi:class 3 adenylate cyclase